MSEQNGDNVLAWLLAAGVSVGVWEWWKRYRANNPDMLEADAFKILQKNINPFSADDLDTQMQALAKLEEARIRREHADLERRGFPIDHDMEQATLEMMRQNYTLGEGLGGCEKLLDASGRLYQQAKQTAQAFGHPDFARRNGCAYCSGVGWSICSACQGCGKNRAVPYPTLSGIEAVDALILARYAAAAVCPGCRGQGQVHCSRCGGTGIN